MNRKAGEPQSSRRARAVLPLLAGLLTAFALARLGVWQTHRAEEKTRLYQAFHERATATRIALASRPASEPLAELWRPALVSGTPQAPTLLLDNRVQGGKVGYEVLNPLRLADGRTVLVNRGWVQAPPSRDEWPRIPMPSSFLDATVRIAPAPSMGIRLAGFGVEKGPRELVRVPSLDFKALSAILGIPLEPYQLLLDEGQPDGYDRHWKLPDPDAGKHQAYAFQWFAMATAMLILTCYHGFRRLQPRPPHDQP